MVRVQGRGRGQPAKRAIRWMLHTTCFGENYVFKLIG